MLTMRGIVLTALTAILLLASAVSRSERAALVATTLAAWLLWEWIWFAIQACWLAPRLCVKRRWGEASRHNVWTDRPTMVTVEVAPSGSLPLGRLRIEERPPVLGTSKGTLHATGRCTALQPLRITYTYESRAAGMARFEGLAVDVMDGAGLFRRSFFLRTPDDIAVLPPIVVDRTHQPTLKPRNQLPTQGIHRHRRAGSGSELLDLRDYVVGDPPKSIAWKVSARRDRLMTKDYESEVPVRCTLFMDVSESVRVGSPDRTALAGSVQVVATVARKLLAQRDPVGLCLFDNVRSEIIPPSVGERAAVRLMLRLASACARPPEPSECPTGPLVDAVYDFSRATYPELLQSAVNRQPFSFFGFRFAPGTFWLLVALVSALNAGITLPLVSTLFGATPWMNRMVASLVLAFVAVPAALMVLVRWWMQARRGGRILPHRRRKQASGVLAAYHDLGPTGLALLDGDDELFSWHAQQFLIAHRVPYPRPLHDRNGRYLFHARNKVDLLARQILRTVAHGRDNELLVIVADLLELEDEWPRLFRSIRVAVARHHQVVVVCPWPAGLERTRRGTWRSTDPAIAIEELDAERFPRSYERLRHELGRLGVAVLIASQDEASRQILRRVEQLRQAFIRR